MADTMSIETSPAESRLTAAPQISLDMTHYPRRGPLLHTNMSTDLLHARHPFFLWWPKI